MGALAILRNLACSPRYGTIYVLRVIGDPLTYVNSVREIVHQADARLPVTNITTEAAAIDRAMGQEIAFARLCSAFAMLALAIACVGLYAAVAFSVARRTGAERSGNVDNGSNSFAERGGARRLRARAQGIAH